MARFQALYLRAAQTIDVRRLDVPRWIASVIDCVVAPRSPPQNRACVCGAPGNSHGIAKATSLSAGSLVPSWPGASALASVLPLRGGSESVEDDPECAAAHVAVISCLLHRATRAGEEGEHFDWRDA